MVFLVNHKSKNTTYYLNSTLEIYEYYNSSLFSIYKEKSLLLIYTINYIKLNSLEKNMVNINFLIDGK